MIKKIVEVEMYISPNGLAFNTEGECLWYEKELAKQQKEEELQAKFDAEAAAVYDKIKNYKINLGDFQNVFYYDDSLTADDLFIFIKLVSNYNARERFLINEIDYFLKGNPLNGWYFLSWFPGGDCDDTLDILSVEPELKPYLALAQLIKE